jgi:hypothetical protein
LADHAVSLHKFVRQPCTVKLLQKDRWLFCP